MKRRSSPQDVAAANPEIPERLGESLLAAKGQTVPEISEETNNACPLLFEWLAPRKVKLPSARPGEKAVDAFMEPLLLISWDRRAGSWKWTISNKTLNYGCGGAITELSKSFEQIEELLRLGKINPRELKPLK